MPTGNINTNLQYISCVLQNLINNDFYAYNEQLSLIQVSRSAFNGKGKSYGKDYNPTVTVIIKKKGNFIQNSVSDNGNGIPQSIMDKISQTFFTTKPAGKGTGLGLSLSFDIVVKGHGGALEVEGSEGEGAIFRITLLQKE